MGGSTGGIRRAKPGGLILWCTPGAGGVFGWVFGRVFLADLCFVVVNVVFCVQVGWKPPYGESGFGWCIGAVL